MADTAAVSAGGSSTRTLTKPQSEVLTELTKILMTLKQINESLLDTISKTAVAGGSGADSKLRKAQVAAVKAGSEAFKAFAVEEEDGNNEDKVL